jgi:hypothetical protein
MGFTISNSMAPIDFPIMSLYFIELIFRTQRLNLRQNSILLCGVSRNEFHNDLGCIS